MEILAPLGLIFVGIILKNTNNNEYQKLKKYWIYFIMLGSLILILKIINLSLGYQA